jgi:RNA polymerase sigma factor (sigma-70 family)
MRSRSDEVEAFFTKHARRLERIVGANVIASNGTVEDACSFAWLQLARRPDIDLGDDRAFGWLYRIAVREAWRLTAAERVTVSLTSPRDDCEALAALEPASSDNVEDAVGARCRLDALRMLPERERRILLLFAFGFSYAEIAKRTGDTVRTIDRQLRRARERLRDAGRQSLAARERAVLARIADGLTVRAIAAELELREETVREYLAGAYRKLGVSTRSEATVVHGVRHSV